METDPQIIGLAALYAVIELVKFFVSRYQRNHSILTDKERYYLASLHEKQKGLSVDLTDHFKSTEETAHDARAILKALERVERKVNNKS